MSWGNVRIEAFTDMIPSTADAPAAATATLTLTAATPASLVLTLFAAGTLGEITTLGRFGGMDRELLVL